ncbi:MAG: hypothetical protein Kow0075_04770 [Salibacteraceae bacterium]
MSEISIAFWEIALSPVYLAAIAAFGFGFISKENQRWFFTAFAIRLFGALFFLAIYLFYYKGGDTLSYYISAKAIINLILENPKHGLTFYFEGFSRENMSFFTLSTGRPYAYICQATDTFGLVRILVPVQMLGLNSYLLTTILMAFIGLYGPWSLFNLIRNRYKNFDFIAFVCVVAFPSVVFWGSGISKDTITYAATCYIVHSVYKLFILKKFGWGTVIFAALNLFALIQIKPYVFMVLLPGSILWVFHNRVMNIKNPVLRFSIFPLVIAVSSVLFGFILIQLGDSLGEYSLENILNKALITKEDLSRDYYGTNSFDIGRVDPTVFGILSKFPIATFYGLFGPTLLSVNNVVMLFSALENTLLLGGVFAMFFKKGLFRSIRLIGSSPFLMFCAAFTVLFAFSIGFTTPNYGALVRFKIPLIPMFTLLIAIIYTKSDEEIKSF